MKPLISDVIQIEVLKPASINSEYLSTLNDNEYMQFSRHANSLATVESQTAYITGFNNFDNWILGITEKATNTLVGTTNLSFDFVKLTVSIGFLVFMTHRGIGFA